ncbi:MAG: MalY/PatB family protein [Salinivirgaceae bacterium]|mgnify:FL=1|jgi:cystathionine beta-lyase|nr:pyridoxal phosphate-dependent aminotransferase [Bacteroidales bacterium]
MQNFDEIIDRKNTNCVKHDGMESFIGAKDAIPMWVADMDFRTPKFIIDSIKKRLEHEILGYTFRSDIFYKSIIDWHKRRHGWQLKKEWLSFSPGVVAGFAIAIEQLTDIGDKIIVQPPVYFPFFQTINALNRVTVNNPLKLENGRLNMDFDNLSNIIDNKTKAIIISNPHNPGGTVWTKQELLTLNDICLKNNILVISDEIHADIVYQPHKYTPFASISKEASMNSITVMSHSKTFNIAGLSTSYVFTENKLMLEKYNKLLNTYHLNGGNIFGTEALIAAYNYGEEWLEDLISYLSGNIEFVDNYLKQKIPKIKAIIPESTFLIWLDCRDLGLNSNELKDFFYNKSKVAVNEGISFGQEGEGFMRLNIGTPRSIVEKAMTQIKHAYDKL